MHRVPVRERGIALLAVVGIMITMFGATASVIMVLSARSRAMTDTANETGALYLAEAGIESAKYEIAKAIDTGGDGVGNVTTQTADGEYVVEAQDLGNNTWQLTSTGSYGDHDMTIEAVVGHSKSTKFPGAAAAFVGDYDAVDFKFKWKSDVLIDGGSMPAFVVSSPEFYQALGTDLANEIASGKLPPDSIVGAGSSTFMPDQGNQGDGGVSLPKEISRFLDDTAGDGTADKIEQALADKTMLPEDLKAKLPSHLQSAYETWVTQKNTADGAVELPIQLTEAYAESLHDLNDLYSDAVAKVYDDIVPEADLTLELHQDDLNHIEHAKENLADVTSELASLYKQVEDLKMEIAAELAAGKHTNGEENALAKLLAKDIPDALAAQQAAVDILNGISDVHDDETIVWGTEDEPMTVYITKPMDLKDDTLITGYGTLVIDDRLKIHSGAEIDWNGDVILIGNDKKNAVLDVHGGDFTVTGNLMVLGYGDKNHVNFDVDHNGLAKIDGSVLISTPFTSDQKNKAGLTVNSGELAIGGLFTMLGADLNVDFKHDSDVTIHGMWQSAAPMMTDKHKDKVKLKIDGNLEVVYDNDLVNAGIEELLNLALEYELPEIPLGLISEDMDFYSWNVVSTSKN